MKKMLVVFILLLIFTLPTAVFAHTELSSSSPEAGQVITEETKEISLTFGGEIESLSTMTLVKDGQEIQFESIQAQGNQLIGLLGSSLESGSYIIHWNIAGEDGHPIKGDIPFSVQLPEEETQNNTEEEPVEQEITEEVNEVETENQTESGSKLTIIIPIVAILLLVIGMFILFRKKK